jgi:hypothetical protein
MATVGPYTAFNGTTANWLSAAEIYEVAPLGAYLGAVSTTVSGVGVAYAGEWLQLQVPAAIYADKLHFRLREQAPLNGIHVGSVVVAGSNDGATWSLISSHPDMPSWDGDHVLVTGATTAYTYIRLIILKMRNSGLAVVRELRIVEYERPVLQAQLAEVQTDIAAKADQTAVDGLEAALALKATQTTVDAALALKAT